jgi:Arc/MetJ-type ribon-helix-helix transcriptional regulator
MAIRAPKPRTRASNTRTTLSLPTEQLEKMDAEVREGRIASRNDFVRYAIAMELWRREQAAIDAAIIDAMSDPENIAEGDRIMHEFRFADAETARAIDAEFGPWTESD